MARYGPIIAIEDDRDDKELLIETLQSLEIENELVCFDNAIDAFDYLKKTLQQPFLILCDVNLPALNGIEFKRKIDADPELRKKSIPFIFYSTSVNQQAVNEAYTKMTVQGFFKKGDSFEQIRKRIKLIMDYWKDCKHPNTN
ncbi:MAG TPA: response regulator [Ferruginibacter sp.]|nr:response regulator [Ferruginibacter sp.]